MYAIRSYYGQRLSELSLAYERDVALRVHVSGTGRFTRGPSFKPRRFCPRGNPLLRVIAYTSNILLIIFATFIVDSAHGTDRFLALLLLIPAFSSLLVFRKQGDREERDLRTRIRKAYLRKELKELSEFDV